MSIRLNLRLPPSTVSRARIIRAVSKRLGDRIEWGDMMERGIGPIEDQLKSDCKRMGVNYDRLLLECLKSMNNGANENTPTTRAYEYAPRPGAGFVDSGLS